MVIILYRIYLYLYHCFDCIINIWSTLKAWGSNHHVALPEFVPNEVAEPQEMADVEEISDRWGNL